MGGVKQKAGKKRYTQLSRIRGSDLKRRQVSLKRQPDPNLREGILRRSLLCQWSLDEVHSRRLIASP